MKELEIHVFVKRDQLLTSSIEVAERFGKRHDNVLSSIRRIIADTDKWGALNFKETSYIDDSNRRSPMFEMTRSGFSVLAMGFSGKAALQWKIKFDSAFNAMESALLNQKNLSWQSSRQQGKTSRLEETDTIKDFVAYAHQQGSIKAEFYYKHLTKATYKALFIITDKYPGSFRDLLSTAQLSFLATAEHVTAKALQDGMAQGLFYKDIYVLAKNRLESLAGTVGVTPVISISQQALPFNKQIEARA